MRQSKDSLDGRARFAFIVTVIVLDAILEETIILGAEFMMIVRRTRDLLRYDLRWTVQEKLRRLWHRN